MAHPSRGGVAKPRDSQSQPGCRRSRSMLWNGRRWIDERAPELPPRPRRRAREWAATGITIVVIVALAIPFFATTAAAAPGPSESADAPMIPRGSAAALKLTNVVSGGPADPSAWTLTASTSVGSFSGPGPVVGPYPVAAGVFYHHLRDRWTRHRLHPGRMGLHRPDGLPRDARGRPRRAADRPERDLHDHQHLHPSPSPSPDPDPDAEAQPHADRPRRRRHRAVRSPSPASGRTASRRPGRSSRGP